MGPEAALVFSFPPAIATCNFINDVCSSHRPYLIWGRGRLRARGSTWGRLYLQTKEWTWKDSLEPPPPSLQHSSEPFYKSWRLRFKVGFPHGEARTLPLPPRRTPSASGPPAVLPSALCKHRCALSPHGEEHRHPHFPLPGAMVWAPSGNYTRCPKVWLMFQRFEPTTGCTLSRTQRVIGGPGV